MARQRRKFRVGDKVVFRKGLHPGEVVGVRIVYEYDVRCLSRERNGEIQHVFESALASEDEIVALTLMGKMDLYRSRRHIPKLGGKPWHSSP